MMRDLGVENLGTTYKQFFNTEMRSLEQFLPVWAPLCVFFEYASHLLF